MHTLMLRLAAGFLSVFLPAMLLAPGTAAQTTLQYAVRAGDTLYSISRRYDLSVDQLKALNGLSSNVIHVGQELIVGRPVLRQQPEASLARVDICSIRHGDTRPVSALRCDTSVEATRSAIRLPVDVPAAEHVLGHADGASLDQRILLEATPARAKNETTAGAKVETPLLSLVPALFGVQVALSSVYDSNINHDEEYLRSSGLVPGVGVYFRSSIDDPVLELSYETAHHDYTNTEQWDRLSNRFRALVTPDLDGAWRTETEVEVSLKGSSEDRDLSNQYIAAQEVEYRLSRENRFQGYAVFRLRRYPENPSRNANNPQAGLVFERRLPQDRRFEAGVRYDQNLSDNVKRRYKRWTYEVEFSTPFLGEGRDELELEVKYRDKRYERLIEVEVDDEEFEVPRQDGQWTMRVSWQYPITRSIELRLAYGFESRTSNDLDKLYDAHRFDLTFVYALW